MKQFLIKLQSDDSNHNETVAFGMPLKEWDRAQRFLQAVKKLRNTRFVQEGMGGSISVTVSVEQGVSSRAGDIDDEAVGNMFLKIRPFILQNEPDVNFQKISNLLSRYVDHSILRRELKSFSAMFKLQRMQFVKSFGALGQPPMTFDEIDDLAQLFRIPFRYRKAPGRRAKIRAIWAR